MIEIRLVVTDNKLRKAKSLSPWITMKLIRKFEKRKKLYRISKRRPYDTAFIGYFNKFCYKQVAPTGLWPFL